MPKHNPVTLTGDDDLQMSTACAKSLCNNTALGALLV
jgi:hypothetical protein